MRDKVYGVLTLVVLIGIVSIVPYVIKGFFWILLQMMLFPLTTLIILGNIMLWSYVISVYTEKKKKKIVK